MDLSRRGFLKKLRDVAGVVGVGVIASKLPAVEAEKVVGPQVTNDLLPIMMHSDRSMVTGFGWSDPGRPLSVADKPAMTRYSLVVEGGNE